MLSGGGVGRNIAEGLYKLHGDVYLISAIGNDESGNNLKSSLPVSCNEGVIIDRTNSTAICTVIFDQEGDCKLVLGDMKIHNSITSDVVLSNEKQLARCPLIVIDGNLSVDTIGTTLEIAKKYDKPVFFEPTDMRIADKPFSLPKTLTKQIKFISPNIYELNKITKAMSSYEINVQSSTNIDIGVTLNEAKELACAVSEHFDCIIVTLGALGVLIVGRDDNSNRFFDDKFQYIPQQGVTKYRYYSAPKLEKLVNVSGAGDSFTSGFITAMLSGKTEEICISYGFNAARCALLAESAVPDKYFSNDSEKNEWISNVPTVTYV